MGLSGAFVMLAIVLAPLLAQLPEPIREETGTCPSGMGYEKTVFYERFNLTKPVVGVTARGEVHDIPSDTSDYITKEYVKYKFGGDSDPRPEVFYEHQALVTPTTAFDACAYTGEPPAHIRGQRPPFVSQATGEPFYAILFGHANSYFWRRGQDAYPDPVPADNIGQLNYELCTGFVTMCPIVPGTNPEAVLCTERTCPSWPRITAFTTSNLTETTFIEAGRNGEPGIPGTSVSLMQGGKERYRSDLIQGPDNPPQEFPGVSVISYHLHYPGANMDPIEAEPTLMQITNPTPTGGSWFGPADVSFDPEWLMATNGWTLDPERIVGCVKLGSPSWVLGTHVSNTAPYDMYGVQSNGEAYGYPSDTTTFPDRGSSSSIEAYDDFIAAMHRYTPEEYDVILDFQADGRVYREDVPMPSTGDGSAHLEQMMLAFLGVPEPCQQCAFPTTSDPCSVPERCPPVEEEAERRKRKLLFSNTPGNLPCCI